MAVVSHLGGGFLFVCFFFTRDFNSREWLSCAWTWDRPVKSRFCTHSFPGHSSPTLNSSLNVNCLLWESVCTYLCVYMNVCVCFERGVNFCFFFFLFNFVMDFESECWWTMKKYAWVGVWENVMFACVWAPPTISQLCMSPSGVNPQHLTPPTEASSLRNIQGTAHKKKTCWTQGSEVCHQQRLRENGVCYILRFLCLVFTWLCLFLQSCESATQQ